MPHMKPLTHKEKLQKKTLNFILMSANYTFVGFLTKITAWHAENWNLTLPVYSVDNKKFIQSKMWSGKLTGKLTSPT